MGTQEDRSEVGGLEGPRPFVPVSLTPTTRPLPRWDQPVVHPRIRSSASTFGLTGRLVMSGLVVAFLCWMFSTGMFALFVVAAVPALAWFVKDTWKRAPETRAPLRTHPLDDEALPRPRDERFYPRETDAPS